MTDPIGQYGALAASKDAEQGNTVLGVNPLDGGSSSTQYPLNFQQNAPLDPQQSGSAEPTSSIATGSEANLGVQEEVEVFGPAAIPSDTPSGMSVVLTSNSISSVNHFPRCFPAAH